MDRVFIIIGSCLGFFGVAFGAFGAHALAARLTPKLMDIYQTGVQYHLIHALAVLALGLWLRHEPMVKTVVLAGWLMVGGVLLFSGSLYLLAVFDQRWLGGITPIGGVLLLSSWALLVVGASRRN